MLLIQSLIVLSLAVLHGSKAQDDSNSIQTYKTVRIEFDPDASSVHNATTCTDDFFFNLTQKLTFWFTEGVASYTSSYPQVAHPFIEFNNTVQQGGGGGGDEQRRNMLLLKEETPLVSNAVADDEVEHRNLCSITNCVNCCPQYCSVWCGGQCNLCGGGRNLIIRRSGRRRRRRRQVISLDESSNDNHNNWWWGDQTMQSGVAHAVQLVAQQWLFDNDPTQCMGNAWKLQVQVSYF